MSRSRLARANCWRKFAITCNSGRRRLGVHEATGFFGLDWSRQFKAVTAQRYAGTYDNLLKRLCCGRLLHIDETSASVMGKNSYVWVLTSMEEVAGHLAIAIALSIEIKRRPTAQSK